MRRFSNRNQLVTLNEINVTPLLDLAFVLLIIFIITTPVLESSVDLDLPVGESTPITEEPKKEDIRTVEIDRAGQMWLDRQQMNLEQIEWHLRNTFQTNKNLIVAIRADKNGRVGVAVEVLDRCKKHGIDQVSFTTELSEE